MVGYDAAQISALFSAGPDLTAIELDVNTDRIPYFKWDEDTQDYILSVVSPAELYAAMSA